jgi:hypothetical protein
MRRRLFIAAAGCAGAAGAWLPARGAQADLGAHAAVPLVPEARALRLNRFTPAAGPLERHAARPGAWYALLALPVAPQWPMQLLLWSSKRGHEVRALAMDAAPGDAPGVVHELPLTSEASRSGGAPRLSARFMLPAASTAPEIFVLVEQWRSDFAPPAPLWVQLLAQRAAQPTQTPWWLTREPGERAALAPPSPLTQQTRGGKVHEVPIFSLPALPETGVWR